MNRLNMNNIVTKQFLKNDISVLEVPDPPKPKQILVPPPPSDAQFIEVLKRIVKTEISRCPSGMEIEVLCSVLGTNSSVRQYKSMLVRDDLLLHLQPFSVRQIELFGSSVIGIAFPGSDLDIYIKIVNFFNTDVELLNEVKDALEKSGCFTHFELVSNARVPIIKCVHIPTASKCDLSFTNSAGVQNSKIMKHLLHFDSRIHILAVIVKFWMKSHNLIGSQLMSSYCTMWLLFFYLQQLRYPVLPPIEVFQRGGAPFFIGTANLAFNYQIPNLLRNTDRISTLLVGFFEFYEKFDFEAQFISPLYGQAFPRHNFERDYPQHFRLYREILNRFSFATPMQFGKPICVQDPFDICETKPGRVSTEYFKAFKYAIANTARVSRENLMKTGESKELLLCLFESDIILPRNFQPFEQTNVDYETIQENIAETIIATGGKSFKITAMDFEIECAYRRLCLTMPNKHYRWDISEIVKLWSLLCTRYLVNVLKLIFGFEFSIDHKDIFKCLNEPFHISAVMDVFHKCKPLDQPVFELPELLKRTEQFLTQRKSGGRGKGRYYGETMVIKTTIRHDVGNSRVVWIDFHYESNDRKIEQFFDQFASRSRALILAYFKFEMKNGDDISSLDTSLEEYVSRLDGVWRHVDESI